MIRYTAAHPNLNVGIKPAPTPIEAPLRRRVNPDVESKIVPRRILGNSAAGQAERVYQILVHAANVGDPCPKNLEMAARLGVRSGGNIADLTRSLEATGRIRVKRYMNTRVVEIVETGKRTAEPAGSKTAHWKWR